MRTMLLQSSFPIVTPFLSLPNHLAVFGFDLAVVSLNIIKRNLYLLGSQAAG